MNNTDRETPTSGLEVAIIGMALRVPGAKTIEEFWENLKNGIESIAFCSHEELEQAGIDPEEINHPGYVKAKGMLEDLEYFDAPFFDYTAKEAVIMDPQIRIFHQCAWRALEDAGYEPRAYNGLIGIYAGAGNNYFWVAGNALCMRTISQRLTAETLNSQYFSTLISYKLNLRGPAYTLQTACSTSLVAIHSACQALLSGECDMALAGGVSVTFPPKTGYIYQEGMLNSPDGHCRAFDAGSKGTVPGNGAAVVVLKRLEDAAADRDTIWAVIKGSAVNNDGSGKVGYTAPGVNGQAEVIRAAQRMANIDPETVTYIEAHGTGTALGDPVEIEALKLAFRTKKSQKKGFCGIGSLKTNLGHMDSAAGAAGIIKTVLALRHRALPPSLHFHTPNPGIDFQDSPFYVVKRITPWKSIGTPLRAGVSSFGIGGTNAHVVLEEAPRLRPQTTGRGPQKKPQLILLSAKTAAALKRMTENLAGFLKKNPGINLADAAYTLQVGRRAFKHRTMLLAPGVPEMIAALAAPGSPGVRTYFAAAEERPVVFMFPGQGAQYVNMGLGLYQTEPLFRQETDRCFQILKHLTDHHIKDILYPGECKAQSAELKAKNCTITSSSTDTLVKGSYALCAMRHAIDQTEIAQPLLFTIEYALAQLLKNWGITPDAMIGHSIGEYVAACLSGIFSLEDALFLVVWRGKLMGQIPGGSMLSIALPEEQLKPMLTGDLSIAAVNTPTHCVVSGNHQAVERLSNRLAAQGHSCKTLHTSHAFHSPMMDPVIKEFEKKVGQVKLNQPDIPYISNLTGDWLLPGQASVPTYWARHLRQTVSFSEGLSRLTAEKNAVFIEVGPGDTLSKLARKHPGLNSPQEVVNLLRHPRENTPDHKYLLDKIGLMWLYGIDIDWSGFYGSEKRNRIALPTYSFDAHRYWNYRPHQWGTDAPGEPGKLAAPARELSDTDTDVTPDASPRQYLSTAYAPPMDVTQQTLVNTWQELLGFPYIGINDDFFELGGDSLTAINFTSAVQRQTGILITLQKFFKMPTIKAIAGYIHDARKSKYMPIEPTEEQEYYELSSAQKRMYIIQKMHPETTSYNAAAIYEAVTDHIDKNRLQKAFQLLIHRHESLRTSFVEIGGQPLQQVHKKVDFNLEYYEIDDEIGSTYESIMQTFVRAFDLKTAPLMRVGLIKGPGGKQMLMVDVHHIVSDGFSDAIIINDFLALYHEQELAPLPIHYKDFSRFQTRVLNRDEIKKQETYWLEKFSGQIPVSNLPPDYPQQAVKSFDGNMVHFEIGSQQTRALHRLAQRENSTLFMVLLAVYNRLISGYGGSDQVIIGIPTAGRRAGLENIIGMFVNTLPLKNNIPKNKSFKEFLGQIKDNTLRAFDNQDYPFEKLVEKIVLTRDTSHNPLFEVVFDLLNITPPEVDTPALKLQKLPFDDKVSAFDLILVAREKNSTIKMYFKYGVKIFKQETIKRFTGYFKQIVSAVIRNPDEKFAAIDMISPREKERVLYEFNNTSQAWPDKQNLQELLEDRAGRNPGKTALVETDGRQIITYRRLNEKVNQLARYIKEKYAVQPGDIIGVCLERSIEMIIAILGVIKAGAGYLAIDPGYPGERVLHMLQNSRSRQVVIDKTRPQLLDDFSGEMINIFKESADISRESSQNLQTVNKPTDVLYVIYTSGSTGVPNGAMLSHDILTNLVRWQKEKTAVDSSLRCLQFTSTSFCVSFQEIMTTLTSGGQLHLIDEIERRDIRYLMDFIVRRRIEILYLPFSYLNFLFNEMVPRELSFNHLLKHIITAGEQLKITSAMKEFLERNPDIKLHNHYGSSEMHVVTSYTLDASTVDLYPIPPVGTPIANTRIYILDEYHNPVPIGVWGEICVAGCSEVLGYINTPGLTEKKLQTHPALPEKQRLYHSGDIGRWQENGTIQLQGRKDDQVKIRGFRVEPGEIESKLLLLDGVKECVVVVKEGPKEKYLLAYVVLDNIHIHEIKKHIVNYLPQYMIPRFMELPALPLMPNGKVDRENLPEPGKTSPHTDNNTIYRLFARQVEGTPDRIALLEKKFGQINARGGIQLSYREVNEKSAGLARQLKEKGVNGSQYVALMMEPSIHMVICILGILKTGSPWIRIDPAAPTDKITEILEQKNVFLLLIRTGALKDHTLIKLRGLESPREELYRTPPRPQVLDFDSLPLVDRSYINHQKYGKHIGLAMVKHTLTLQTTRGCPYNCAFCHKIWPKRHVIRSAENVYREVEIYYKMGFRRFVFVDDIFNLNVKNSRRFFRLIIENNLEVQLMFPAGLRGDILTKDYIDLMVKAGTVNFALALETASPRLQKLIRKDLHLERFREILCYTCETYPQVILELFTMHGFPTETIEEALMTLDFVMNMKWIHFPYINILRIYPGTDMEELALRHGISQKAIQRSAMLAYHELPDTLPFDKSFTFEYQTRFLNEYFLAKERLLHVLPFQMKVLSEDEIVQKYNSFLPTEITSFNGLLEFTGIKREELTVDRCLEERLMAPVQIDKKIGDYFATREPDKDALRVLLLDLSQRFVRGKSMLYDGVETPLGLMYLMTYLEQQLGGKVTGATAKSRTDFENYQQLKNLLEDFKPQVIGIRTLTYFADFFHEAAALIRQWGIHVPIIAGGPYATSDYTIILKDPNIDLLVLGEGEITFCEVIEKMIENKGKLPPREELKKIPGLVFADTKHRTREQTVREVLLLDGLVTPLTENFSPGPAPCGFDPPLEQLLEPITRETGLNMEYHPGAPAENKQPEPADNIENTLLGIWAEVLEIEKGMLNRESNFFELGGHSLKATRLIAKIHKAFNVNIKLIEIFQGPTVRETAEIIKKEAAEKFTPIEPGELKEYHELSSAQKRLYILHRMDPGSLSYNMPNIVELRGEYNRKKMENTFRRLIRRHESLRTSFEIIGKQPRQKIYRNLEFQLEYYDQAPGSKGKCANETHRLVRSLVRPFDLSLAPLFRAALIKTAEEKYTLMVDMHHIVCDGVSHEIIVNETRAIYNGARLPVLRLQYKDFAHWQQQRHRSGKMKEQEDYWLKQFADGLPVLEVPTDFTRPRQQSFAGRSVKFIIGKSDTRLLKAAAGREGTTMFMLLLALFNILLSKLADQEDIIVGTVVAGRRHTDLANIIGMFSNTLALRNYPREHKTFSQFLKEVKKRTLEAFENQDYQFEDLVEKVMVTRDTSRNPIFDYMCSFGVQAPPKTPPNSDKTTGESENLHQQGVIQWETGSEAEEDVAKFDIVFTGADTGTQLNMTIIYCTKLFKKQTIERWCKYFKKIVHIVLENENIQLKDINIIADMVEPGENIFQESESEFAF